MNEFIEQFLIEGRDLVEQATSDLLALEQQPDDAPRLDGVRRALHTLKGAAGIVDFSAMSRLLHSAEDALAQAGTDANRVTPVLAGRLLACLDQVGAWMDAMQRDGAVPSDADAEAAGVIASFAAAPAAPEAADLPSADWVKRLADRFPAMAGEAGAAVRYAPAHDCFFHGKDPLEDIAALPGLLAIEILPGIDWPALADLDPFTCEFALTALSSAEPAGLREWREALGERVEIVGVRPDPARLPPLAQAILRAQIELLAETGSESPAARFESARRVTLNVLHRLGRASASVGAVQALAATDPDGLVAALARILEGDEAAPAAAPSAPVPAPETPARGLRIDVAKIEALIKLAAELNVVKNAIGHSADLAGLAADPAFGVRLKQQYGQLDRLVTDLQRSVLGIRVLPLRHVFQRFPRLVREMAAGVGKSARLLIEGETTEADKAVVESLFEPLLHVLRNAVDHGIEPVPQRAAAGKPPMAAITLRARRSGEQVIVEVEDDGAGIDVDKVRAVAARRAVASVEVLASLTDQAVMDMIFAPGFSTAAEITDLSGRGVGMDAVRSGIDRMGGSVAVESRAGGGTLVRFALPFTVLMTRVMTVETGGQVFGLPIEAVVETVRLPRRRIAAIGQALAFVHRNRTIPLIGLMEALGSRHGEAAEEEARIVIVEAGGEIAGFEVERFGAQFDIMLKPLEGLLAGVRGISGTTLLGDGRVLLVLDPQELIR